MELGQCEHGSKYLMYGIKSQDVCVTKKKGLINSQRTH
jgi:hypothetical protein